MTMKYRPDRQWYARRIAETLDDDFVIGPDAFAEGQAESVQPLPAAFGTLVRLARRNKRLTIEQLAEKLTVDAEELRQIETDGTFQARPRTIANIAKFFDFPMIEVLKLAGAAVSNDDLFREQAMKFAAHSEDMSALTKDEQQLLHEFVRFLRDKN